jgi:CheY-like chemotaxis protein
MGTILLVEDTPSEMELISHYLRESGYVVIAAQTAKEALSKAVEQRPDAVVTDVVMPGMPQSQETSCDRESADRHLLFQKFGNRSTLGHEARRRCLHHQALHP